MNKIKYLFKTANKIHKETNKNIIIIILDILMCKIKLKASIDDYQNYNIYKLNKVQRTKIITTGINDQFIKKYNNENYLHYFTNKSTFNKKFNKYLMRDWLQITPNNYNEFKKFIDKYPQIMTKDQETSEVTKYKSTNNNKKVFNKLNEIQEDIVEENIEQIKQLAQLSFNSNTIIRFITINNNIVACYMIINNHTTKELIVPINVETGIVDNLAVDQNNQTYEQTPETKKDIFWLQVPKWPRIIRFVNKLSLIIPQVKYVSWDIYLTNEGPALLNASAKPQNKIYNIIEHQRSDYNLLKIFEKSFKEGEIKNENSHSN